jgi:hypothetical protein
MVPEKKLAEKEERFFFFMRKRFCAQSVPPVASPEEERVRELAFMVVEALGFPCEEYCRPLK